MMSTGQGFFVFISKGFSLMDRNRCIIVVLLVSMMLVDISSASVVLNLRKLFAVTVIQRDSSPATDTHIPPLPGPVSKQNETNPGVVDDASKSKNATNPKATNNSSNLEPPTNNNTTSNSTSINSGNVATPIDKQIVKEKNHEVGENEENTKSSASSTTESCEGVSRSCTVEDTMVACIRTFQGSKEGAVVVQNKGDKMLKVNLTIPTSMDVSLHTSKIPGHQTIEKKISSTMDLSKTIVLSSDIGECLLQTNFPYNAGNFFDQLSFYSKQVTPIYGAYIFLIVALIFGGTFAFCKLKKRKSEDGVAYQELEMGVTESDTAVNVETAEGWDDHWDDDWDEDNSVKSPGGRHIMSNGLSSRSAKKDGWDMDWDD